MSALELLLGPEATNAGATDVPGFGPIIGILCTIPPILVGVDAFSAPASDRGGSIEGEAICPLQPPTTAVPPGTRVPGADAPPAFSFLVAAFLAWSAYFSRRRRSAAAGKTRILMLGIGFGATGLALAAIVYGSRTSADIVLAAVLVVAVSYVRLCAPAACHKRRPAPLTPARPGSTRPTGTCRPTPPTTRAATARCRFLAL